MIILLCPAHRGRRRGPPRPGLPGQTALIVVHALWPLLTPRSKHYLSSHDINEARDLGHALEKQLNVAHTNLGHVLNLDKSGSLLTSLVSLVGQRAALRCVAYKLALRRGKSTLFLFLFHNKRFDLGTVPNSAWT